jgi:hypothetical protein
VRLGQLPGALGESGLSSRAHLVADIAQAPEFSGESGKLVTSSQALACCVQRIRAVRLFMRGTRQSSSKVGGPARRLSGAPFFLYLGHLQ